MTNNASSSINTYFNDKFFIQRNEICHAILRIVQWVRRGAIKCAETSELRNLFFIFTKLLRGAEPLTKENIFLLIFFFNLASFLNL